MTAPCASVFDQPSDAEVTDSAALLHLRPYEMPEGFVSWNGNALVRIPRMPAPVLDIAEARAWVELLLNGIAEAEQALEDAAREETS